MKTLLILLFPMLTFGQQRTYENYLIISSCWYNEQGVIDENSEVTLNNCYFVTSKYAASVELIILTKEPILSPIFIFTGKGNYSQEINSQIKKKGLSGVYYRSCIELEYSNKTLWTCLDAVVKSVDFYTGKKSYKLIINDNLKKLKSYGR